MCRMKARHVDGVDIAGDRESLRRSMAVCSRKTCCSTCRSGKHPARHGSATDEEVVEAAKKAEIHRYIMSCRRNTTPRSASAATRCRAGNAAHCDCPRHRPQSSVLLLDEATSALDQTTEAAINMSC